MCFDIKGLLKKEENIMDNKIVLIIIAVLLAPVAVFLKKVQVKTWLSI